MSLVGVKSTFRVRGKVVHRFSSDAGGIGRKEIKCQDAEGGFETDRGQYDYKYTGRHDHGDLPELKFGGVHGELIQALEAGKADSDAYLTDLIGQGRLQCKGDEEGKDDASAETTESGSRDPDGDVFGEGGNGDELRGLRKSSDSTQSQVYPSPSKMKLSSGRPKRKRP
ncbi:unnamed protein product [Discosporangium mesarthrocarpum]